MSFDGTISIGTIIQVAVMIIAIFKFHGDMVEIKVQHRMMWNAFVKQGERLTDVEANQRARMMNEKGD
jgi:hypothetical protein